MKHYYLSDATSPPSEGRNNNFIRQALLLASAIFLIMAPWPDALGIAQITAGFIAG